LQLELLGRTSTSILAVSLLKYCLRNSSKKNYHSTKVSRGQSQQNWAGKEQTPLWNSDQGRDWRSGKLQERSVRTHGRSVWHILTGWIFILFLALQQLYKCDLVFTLYNAKWILHGAYWFVIYVIEKEMTSVPW